MSAFHVAVRAQRHCNGVDHVAGHRAVRRLGRFFDLIPHFDRDSHGKLNVFRHHTAIIWFASGLVMALSYQSLSNQSKETFA